MFRNAHTRSTAPTSDEIEDRDLPEHLRSDAAYAERMKRRARRHPPKVVDPVPVNGVLRLDQLDRDELARRLEADRRLQQVRSRTGPDREVLPEAKTSDWAVAKLLGVSIVDLQRAFLKVGAKLPSFLSEAQIEMARTLLNREAP